MFSLVNICKDFVQLPPILSQSREYVEYDTEL